MALSATVDRSEPDAAEPTAWPIVWARCWRRIRTWRLPPQWASRDWYHEARAQGGLADTQARQEFNPTRGVPLEAFLFRRIVDAVWTRYRQEWRFGLRTLPQEAAGEDSPSARPRGRER